MHERIDYAAVSPAGVDAMRALDRYLQRSALGRSLIELVKIRASLLNGCAFCIDMHTKDARARGETEQRIYALSAWRETPFFDARERAALEWTEVVTKITAGVPNEVFASVRQQFDEAQLVDLTYAIVAINGWNRVAIAFGKVPGTHQPVAAPASSDSGRSRET
jgi:AhpD family alkylhydroperoxidase